MAWRVTPYRSAMDAADSRLMVKAFNMSTVSFLLNLNPMPSSIPTVKVDILYTELTHKSSNIRDIIGFIMPTLPDFRPMNDHCITKKVMVGTK